MNKKISTGVGIVIVAILGAAVAAFVWFGQEPQAQVPTQTAVSTKINSMQEQLKKQDQASSQSQIQPIDFSKVQFDACGKKAKYERLPWWNKFSSQIVKIKYYSNSYIESGLEDAYQNETLNPNKIRYAYETFCNDKNFKDTNICGNGKDRKLSLADFSDDGEGCLSKDGSVFIAVFPGEYMGGGNYIFRYNVVNDVLEEAQRINERQAYGSAWVDPPTSFGKRLGNSIKMIGGSGDAGCGSKTEFDYNFAANQIKMAKRCTRCEGEKETCQTF